MAKSKIDEVLNSLKEIEQWASDGLSQGQIAHNLGIGRSTLEKYKKQNIEIMNSLKKGQRRSNQEVENALFKKATGYEVEEVQAYKVKETYYDDKNNKCTKEKIETVTVKRSYPPDLAAIKFWLMNRNRKEWSENPNKDSIDREELNLKKKEFKAKENMYKGIDYE